MQERVRNPGAHHLQEAAHEIQAGSAEMLTLVGQKGKKRVKKKGQNKLGKEKAKEEQQQLGWAQEDHAAHVLCPQQCRRAAPPLGLLIHLGVDPSNEAAILRPSVSVCVCVRLSGRRPRCCVDRLQHKLL